MQDRAQKQEFLDAGLESAVYDGILDGAGLSAEKIGWFAVIGDDPTDLGGS